jgi:GT2 family glycosyltransferase
MDSGDVPEDRLRLTLNDYPWVRAVRLPEGTGYEELKMAGAQAAAGEVVVFADGDCFYDRGWLEALLSPFSESSVSIVGGETSIDSAGLYGLANVIVSSFPARSSSPGLYSADRYHLNNVAFRVPAIE